MAGDLRISMLLTANAAQAKAEVASYKAGLDQLSGATKATGEAGRQASGGLDAVGQSTGRTAAEIIRMAQAGAEWNSAVQMVRASLVPIVAEHAALQEAIASVTAAEEIGALTSTEAARAMDLLQREVTRLQQAMEAAGSSIDGTTTSLARHQTAVQTSVARTTGLKVATDESVASHLRHGMMLDEVRSRFDPLFAASRRYELELREIAEAERLGAISADMAAQARGRAAGAMAPMAGELRGITASAGAASQMTTQLGFQLNDIVMMASTGQAPLMLMMQQGSQVTQVFDNARNAGMKLGPVIAGAFLNLIQPMNLITFAAIGASAAMFQWLTGAGEKVVSLDDRMSRLSSTVADYARSAQAASVPTATLTDKYGDLAAAARGAAEAIAEADRVKALRNVRESSNALAENFGGFGGPVGDLIGSESEETLRTLRFDLGLTREAAVDVFQKLQALGQSTGAAEIAKDALAARDALIQAGIAADNDLAVKLAALSQEAANYVATLKDGPKSIDLAPLIAMQAELSAAAAAATAETIAGLRQEEAIRYQIALFGRDSELVQQSLLTIEREKFAAAELAAGKTQDQVDALLAAWDAAKGFNAEASGMPGLMAATASAAAGIAGGIWNAVTAMVALNEEQAATARAAAYDATGDKTGISGPDGIRAEQWGGGRFTPRVSGAGMRVLTNAARGAAAGAGAGAGADVEADAGALKKFVDEQQRQIDILRMLDPVQKEILRNHKALTGATEAEKDQVAALIRERTRLEEVRDRIQEIGNTGEQAFKGLLSGAMSFRDGLSMVLSKLADMAASNAWDILWNGGGKGGGGFGGFILDMFGGKKKADGGMISGPGGPRDDVIPIWASNGEYMINAEATAKNLPFLHAINAGASPSDIIAMIGGSRPAYADGGLIGSARPAFMGGGSAGGGVFGGGASSGGEVAVRVYVDRSGEWQAEVRRVAGSVAAEVMEGGMEEWSRTALPGRMAEISAQPWRKG